MKFIFGNVLPYRDLPKDFSKRYPSSWVTIPSGLYNAKKAHTMFHEYIAQYEAAVDGGFDAIAFNEHHGSAYGMDNSPNLMAAILSRKVKESEKTCLVLLGNSLPLYHPPIRVAEELSMLDVITGGRLVAGFPLGTSMDANFIYGIPPIELRERFYEALDLIKKSWTATDVFSFNGQYTQIKYVNLWPRPYQQPHPPIWIPGGGSVETYEFSIKNDLPYYFSSYDGIESARKFISNYWKLRKDLGKDLNPYWVGYNQLVIVSETDERAKQEYEEHVFYFYNNLLHIAPEFSEAPGYRTPRSIANSPVRLATIHGQSRYEGKKRTWEEMIESRYIVAGSPQTVRKQLEEIITELRVGNLQIGLHHGSAPHHLTMKNIELFTKEVMPYLQNYWDDEWPVIGWPEIAHNNKNKEMGNSPILS